MTDSLSKPVLLSITAHVALVLAFIVKTFLSPTESIAIRDAIRVDVVGLPEKTQVLPEAPATPSPPAPPTPAPKPVVQTPPPKAKPPAPPKVVLKGKKPAAREVVAKEQNALDRIRAEEALDKIRKDVARSQPVRGNIVAAGNTLTGSDKVDLDKYFAEVESRIHEHWQLPQWLIDAHLKAQALVLIDESGIVKKRQVVKSSGNTEFDALMLDTIDKSSPFPAPPERLRGVLGIRGIVFNFPQRGDS